MGAPEDVYDHRLMVDTAGNGSRFASSAVSWVTDRTLADPRRIPPRRTSRADKNVRISLSVRDIDATLAAITAAGLQPEQDPVEIGGARMFFVRDPDGTPVEFVC